MPCPSISSPPGPFDLLAPHNVFLVGGLTLLLAIIVISTLGWMRSFARHLCSLPTGRERRFLLLLGSFTSIWVLISLLFLSLIGLWAVALVTWTRPEWQPRCPFDPVITALTAYNQVGKVAIALLLGSGVLMGFGGVLELLVQRFAQKRIEMAANH